jgi:hypothetical protein
MAVREIQSSEKAILEPQRKRTIPFRKNRDWERPTTIQLPLTFVNQARGSYRPGFKIVAAISISPGP